MPGWLQMLEASALTAFLRDAVWTDPTLHSLHLLGLAMVVGGASIFDLRLLGRGQTLALDALARLIFPWVWIGFGLAASSGLLLFAESPIELYLNPAFRWKLLLLGIAGVNALFFQQVLYRRVLAGAVRAGSVSAWVSLISWFTILILGRLIAYL